MALLIELRIKLHEASWEGTAESGEAPMHLHVLVIVCTLSKSMIAARDFANKWPLSGVDPEMIAEVVSFPKYRISELLACRVVALPHLHPPPGGGIDEAVRTKR